MTPRLLALDHVGVLGGAELSLLDIAAHLGADVSVRLFVDGPFRAALERRGVDVRVLRLGRLASVRKESRVPSPGALIDAWRLSGDVAMEARNARLLYANSQKAFVVAALAGWRSGRPVVWHLRDLLGPPHFSAVNSRGAVMLANRGAVRVITNSRATGDAFVAAGGRQALVRVVHNGVDAGPFDAVSTAAAFALRGGLAPAGTFVAAVFGRLHPWKGQHVAIEALARLPEECHLWIVGDALFGEQEYAAGLRRQAERLGLSTRVHFLGFRDDVPALMRAADVVVHASTWPEPFGRVVVEGMLAGKPVIATDGGGVPEILADGETGILVPPGDSEAMARAITALRADANLVTRLAAAAGARARRQFTAEAMVRGVRAVFDEVDG